MESMTYWIVFFSAAVALNISPGQDLIYILSKTIAQGRKVGVASTLGVCSGALVHVFAAAFGISAILATSALAFNVVKYAGAAYLVYLGLQALMSKAGKIDFSEHQTKKTTPGHAFKQGALVDILNPKVAIFFMAFLPQFVRPELEMPTVQIVVLGILVILVAIIVEISFVLAAAQTTTFFRKKPSTSAWLDRILGSVLICLGIRLVFVEGAR